MDWENQHIHQTQEKSILFSFSLDRFFPYESVCNHNWDSTNI